MSLCLRVLESRCSACSACSGVDVLVLVLWPRLPRPWRPALVLGCSGALAAWLPTSPHPHPITCRHDGGPVPWCGADCQTVQQVVQVVQRERTPTPLTWVPGLLGRRPVPRPPKHPQEVWRARADHGRIACSCQPFHFWAVTHLGMTLPQPCPSETGQDRPCLRPRMGLFSIHRRLPAFQPSLLASSVMATRAYYRNRNGSGQPNPTSHSRMPLCHKLTCTRPPHPSPHPLSLAVSGLDALDDPHGISTTPTGPCPNDSARWRAGRVEMASKPECCIGHRGAEMG